MIFQVMRTPLKQLYKFTQYHRIFITGRYNLMYMEAIKLHLMPFISRFQSGVTIGTYYMSLIYVRSYRVC